MITRPGCRIGDGTIAARVRHRETGAIMAVTAAHIFSSSNELIHVETDGLGDLRPFGRLFSDHPDDIALVEATEGVILESIPVERTWTPGLLEVGGLERLASNPCFFRGATTNQYVEIAIDRISGRDLSGEINCGVATGDSGAPLYTYEDGSFWWAGVLTGFVATPAPGGSTFRVHFAYPLEALTVLNVEVA
jgi:hypothetical protein